MLQRASAEAGSAAAFIRDLDETARRGYGRDVLPAVSASSRRALRFWFLVGAVAVPPLACSSATYTTKPGAPTLVVPAPFAEGNTGKPALSSSPVATAPVAKSEAAGTGGAASSPSAEVPLAPSTAPDPTALRMAEQVEYELELREGKVSVIGVKPVILAEPVVTPRRLGRYAVELSIGSELIERVRFDFPGTAADEPSLPGAKKRLFTPLTLSERAIARVKVLVPHSARVRRAALVDRALSSVVELEWPFPAVAKAPPAGSASPAAATPAAPPSASVPKP